MPAGDGRFSAWMAGVIVDSIRNRCRERAYSDSPSDHEKGFMKRDSQSHAQPEQQRHPCGIYTTGLVGPHH